MRSISIASFRLRVLDAATVLAFASVLATMPRAVSSKLSRSHTVLPVGGVKAKGRETSTTNVKSRNPLFNTQTYGQRTFSFYCPHKSDRE